MHQRMSKMDFLFLHIPYHKGVIMKSLHLLVFFCFIGFTFADDWPKWRGENSDGISLEKNILTSWPSTGLKKVWSTPLGLGYSGISIANGRVFTLYGDKKRGYEYVITLDAKTGQIIWKKRIDHLYTNVFGDGPRATPTIDGNKVYVVSSNGELLCLNVKNGRKYWGVSMFKKLDAKNISWGMSSSPFIWKNFVYYNIGGKKGSIVAFDKNTGKIKWTSGNYRAGYSTPILIDVNGLEQLVFFTGDFIVGILPKSGQILWEYKWKTDYHVNAATPIFHDNHLFISSGYRSGAILLKLSYNNHIIKARKVWTSRKMKNQFSSSILYEGYLYGFDQTRLRCMNFYTGKLKWLQRGFAKGSLIGVKGHMIILGEKGGLAVAKFSPKKYIQKGFMPLFAKTKCWTVPSISNGYLYVRNEYQLICFNLQK